MMHGGNFHEYTTAFIKRNYVAHSVTLPNYNNALIDGNNALIATCSF